MKHCIASPAMDSVSLAFDAAALLGVAFLLALAVLCRAALHSGYSSRKVLASWILSSSLSVFLLLDVVVRGLAALRINTFRLGLPALSLSSSWPVGVFGGLSIVLTGIATWLGQRHSWGPARSITFQAIVLAAASLLVYWLAVRQYLVVLSLIG